MPPRTLHLRPHARISRDGTFILFQTTAPLSTLDTNGQYDFYIVPNPFI